MARRREPRYTVDIWPGFVDALSTLLLGIIFLLIVFVLGQFLLNQLIAGKDTKLQRLEQAIAQLTDQLSLERAGTAELRLSVAQLTADLQSAQAERDDATAELTTARGERDDLRNQLVTLEDEKNLLAETLNKLRQGETRQAELETDLQRVNQLRAELEAELTQARQSVQTGQQTLEARLAELVQLKRDIEALTEARKKLDQEVAEMAALLKAADSAKQTAASEIARLSNLLETARREGDTAKNEAQSLRQNQTAADQKATDLAAEVARLQALLSTGQDQQTKDQSQIATLQQDLATARKAVTEQQAELERLRSQTKVASDDAADRERRIGELAVQLQAAQTAESSRTTDLEALRKAREALLLELGQVRDRAAELDARLARADERTALAQRELEQRELRIAELLRSAGRAEASLDSERQQTQSALGQVDILNRQINALRVQLAALQQVLVEEKKKVETQDVTIAELGSQLNLALAGKVEELSRFRSEFFGRLRQILGNRPGIQVVGDRFVFQSEILFPSASADLEPRGEEELRKLAQTLRQAIAEIPSDLPWVLQIDGHTDKRPIRNAQFPSNWELSTARAAKVGKFLIDQGIPPGRVAVAGFGEFQPIDQRNDEIAFRRNRRIEIKLTTR